MILMMQMMQMMLPNDKLAMVRRPYPLLSSIPRYDISFPPYFLSLLKFHDSYVKMVQKYEERLELARKSERKWQRTLKFNGLCESIQILQKSEITKRFATFFILSSIFSCEIKIFIVSLQKEFVERWMARKKLS